MTKQIFSLTLFLTLFGLQAQTIDDALRYSLLQPQGTARFAGTGGSMSALGVDFTTLSTNPAGIGWARNGYFVVTPGFKLESSNAQLLAETATNTSFGENDGQLTLPNIGVIFTSQTRSLHWSTFNFGIGINRLADFNESITYQGQSLGSLLESFVEDANDNVFNQFRNELALDLNGNSIFGELGDETVTGDAIFFNDQTQQFESDYPFLSDQVLLDRQGTVTRSGGINELVFSFGGNYREKVMWGLTLGVPFMNYEETKIYEEIDRDNALAAFDDLRFEESLDVSGGGINFKLGLIFRPTQALRVSVAAHSPTFWSVDEEFESTFTYNYTDFGRAFGGTAESPLGEFSYNLQTPWRFMLGAGSVVGKKGFVALDLEYVNYAGNNFSYDDLNEVADALNEQIDSVLTSGINIKGGGEYNLGKLQVRAGAGLQTFPEQNIDQSFLTISGGL